MQNAGNTSKTKQSPKAGNAPAKPVVQTTAPAVKQSLDDLLSHTNSQPYMQLATAMQIYDRHKDKPKFNVNQVGTALYNSLGSIIQQHPGMDRQPENALLLSNIKKNIDYGTFDNAKVAAVRSHTMKFIAPYWEDVKNALSDGEYKRMAEIAFVRKKDFPNLHNELASHDTAKNAAFFGVMLNQMSEDASARNTSNMLQYYNSMVDNIDLSVYKKAGFTDAQASDLAKSAKDTYTKLVNGMTEQAREAHMKDMMGIASYKFSQHVKNVDVGHIKSKIGAAAPYEGLLLALQSKSQPNEA